VHRRERAEFLVRQIAHGDDQVAVIPDLAEVPGPHPGQRQPVPLRGGDRAGVDPLSRMGPGRHRRDRAGPVPQRRRQVRAGRIGSAHEQHPPRLPQSRTSWCVQCAADQSQVGAPPVTVRTAAGDKPGPLQHAQVVGEQVRRHREHRGEFRRRGIPVGQRIGNPQASRVSQRSVHRRPALQVRYLLIAH
jgi:hypothetical protein